MEIVDRIPFYSNTEDNKRCLSACVRMLHPILLGTEIDQCAADEITGFYPGRPTWPFRTMLYFADRDIKITNIEKLDLDAYADDMEAAIISQGGEEVGKKIISKTDIVKESEYTKKLAAHRNVRFEYETPTFQRLQMMLKSNSLVLSSMNYYALKGDFSRYNGHFVLITSIDMDREEVTLNNPGLPPIEEQLVSFETFKKAMYSPTVDVANLIVFAIP